ncbi:MAG: tetratricopeptide (TPR) repeat protein, partial [Gammaproteobacteria bacterium]
MMTSTLRSRVLSALLLVTLAGCQTSAGTYRYEGFGNFERSIATSSSEAQEYFNQGMQLLYGFNHDEAIRSFHQAALLDPETPMPWWGIAYANGININDPAMSAQRSLDARAAADKAMDLIETASPSERALIYAVNARYELPIPDDRGPLDQAYATAMGVAYRGHPNDVDIASLYADALMNLQPWDYWENDGKPKGRATEIMEVLETAMELDPSHPGANHFYIHAAEASQDPDRAVPAADRLRSLVPGSGHLVHMPSHIYIRVGRYSDAVDSNRAAVKADRAYFATAPAPAMYAIYYAHNLHFLAYAAMMSGRYEDAMTAARSLEAEMPKDALRDFAGLAEGIMPTTFHVLIRFGEWEQILLEPEYEDWRLVSVATRFYARSIANSALGRTGEARKEMALFFQAVNEIPDEWYVFNNQIAKVMPIATAMIEGELLYREGRFEEAFATLRLGIEAEDALVYDEPPAWMLPVRHALGALLMGDSRFEEAEAVYLEDLKRNRNNGWALLGLQKSLEGQGRDGEAKALDGKLEAAWIDADVTPQSSCYCEPGLETT